MAAAPAPPPPAPARSRRGGRRPAWRRLRSILVLLGACAVAAGDLAAAGIRGLPFSRVYSLEDIGYIPRGSRLGFDKFGRVSVIHDGVYAVLNDTAWLNLADIEEGSRVPMTVVVQGNDGQVYYGARASWGVAEIRADGKLHAVPLVPPDPPGWTQSTTFEDVFVTGDGIYFASRSGVVFWDRARQACEFHPIAKASKTFRVGDRIFVSSFDSPLQYLDVASRRIQDIPCTALDGEGDNVVERASVLDGGRALLSLLDGRLVAFDGTGVAPWGGGQEHLAGHIAVLQHLADGKIAIAITGRGVFIHAADGGLLSSLTIPQYHRVSDIASRESGVLWLINEDSIEKVLYDSGLTSFGQRLGLPLDWPLVASWNGHTFVASSGVIYRASAAAPGTTARFERLEVQPPNGVWALAAWGSHLLVGNSYGVYAAAPEPDFGFIPITHIPELAHLVMISEGRCLAIGSVAIALLEWDGERWVENVSRLPGVSNPFVVHRGNQSAWIEMGAEGVARVAVKAGALDLTVVPNHPWTTSLWANVGFVDETVVLSGHRGERRFFHEPSGTWRDMPELDRVLRQSPEWLARVRNDAQGTLWATHNEGVVRFTPQDDGGYEMDFESFDLINDRYPIVHVLSDNEVWVSASRSLYHVERDIATPIRPVSAPVLVSLMDSRLNSELLASRTATSSLLRLPYAQNNLTFRFFSGSYAWRRTPAYEFRLDPQDPWSALDADSILRFPGLHEGDYHLQVRMASQPGTPGPPLTIPFKILPPWHRTWPAYATYAAAILLAVFGTIRWSGHLARKRHRALEEVVHDRTRQLEATMQKLNEEARITATLAERDRLAGEIHDSVQQGLSGAILQLDTTMKLPALPTHLRTRLHVVRNMVSYARQEVQHAVWDMESSLLEDNDLGEALRKLATFVATGPVAPAVLVTGTPIQLPRATTHHLLRIAQEATTNALRHASAHVIEIRLEYQPDTVALAISDDGIGFHPDAVLTQAGHFGLRGIRARARKLRGQLTFTSSPGEGTAIRILVPLTHALPPVSDAEAERPEQNPNPACR